MNFTFFVRMMALRQKIGLRPKFKRVASKGKLTVYEFRKWKIEVKTLQMMEFEPGKVRQGFPDSRGLREKIKQ